MPDLQRLVKMYPLIFNMFLCLRCSSGLANKICLLCITIPAGRSLCGMLEKAQGSVL